MKTLGRAGLTWPSKQAFKMRDNAGFENPRVLRRYRNPAKWSLRRNAKFENMQSGLLRRFLKTHKVELEMRGRSGLPWSAQQAFQMRVNTGLKNSRSELL